MKPETKKLKQETHEYDDDEDMESDSLQSDQDNQLDDKYAYDDNDNDSNNELETSSVTSKSTKKKKAQTSKKSSKKDTKQNSQRRSKRINKEAQPSLSTDSLATTSNKSSKKNSAKTTTSEYDSDSLTAATSKNKKSTKQPNGSSNEMLESDNHYNTDTLYIDLKKLFKKNFNYTISNIDFEFITDLFNDLPILTETWNRIGFNAETKSKRLDTFYTKLHDTYDGIILSEQELEENIIDKIKEFKTSITSLCAELHLRVEDNRALNARTKNKNMTVLEEEETLRSEYKRLIEQKNKRLEELKKLAKQESELCKKLGLEKTNFKNQVPSDQDLKELEERIKEMEKIKSDRMKQMNSLKDEIALLSQELDTSRSDSFAQLILYESTDVMTLSEDDLIRTVEFRDELKRRDKEIQSEIKSLRSKIRELWGKLNIENFNLKQIISPNNENEWIIPNHMNKRTLVVELRKEHEHCIEIKMQNMQKFVEGVRTDIKQYCGMMFMGSDELRILDQQLLKSTNYNEELLLLHEEKLEDLKFKYEEFEPLFVAAKKWIDLWDKFVEFVEKTKDPQRLKTRGYNMLQEEQARKNFEKQLPKLEEEISKNALEYLETNRQEFFIYDYTYKEYIINKRTEHEESLKKEKQEKQIMRDTIKHNETRYGSKAATPLALRAKRKEMMGSTILSQQHNQVHETMISSQNHQTPCGLIRQSKLQKIEDVKDTPSGKLKKTNGSSGFGSKRKSRTPKSKSSKLRRSKQMQLALAAANQSNLLSTADSTKTQNFSDQINSTIKSTASSSSNYSTNRQPLKNSKAINHYPPSCSSSKFNDRYGSQSSLSSQLTIDNNILGKKKQLFHMTSTASNTFIEEEDLENLEKYPESMDITEKHGRIDSRLNAVAVKMSKLTSSSTQSLASVATASNSAFKFQAQSSKLIDIKQTSCDVNYMEFSRDLPKPIKFGTGATTTLDSCSKFVTSSSVSSISSGSTSGQVKPVNTRSLTQLKSKLTSTKN